MNHKPKPLGLSIASCEIVNKPLINPVPFALFMLLMGGKRRKHFHLAVPDNQTKVTERSHFLLPRRKPTSNASCPPQTTRVAQEVPQGAVHISRCRRSSVPGTHSLRMCCPYSSAMRSTRAGRVARRSATSEPRPSRRKMRSSASAAGHSEARGLFKAVDPFG